MKGVSVVICCHNSSSRLPETLRHLSRQRTDNALGVEMIIIDNNSSDDTALESARIWDTLGSPYALSVFSEPRPGLSFARQKGFQEARYPYILLCDDDNWLEENYLQRAYAIMEENPFIGALGGSSTPAFQGDPPAWYDKVKASYAVGQQGTQSGRVPESRGYLWGAGMVLRKAALEALTQIGFQTILTDRKGKSITSGGDGELCAALRLMGFILYYDEDLKFQHYMTRERLTWPYYLKLLKSFGQARVYLGFYDYVILKQKGQETGAPKEYWRKTRANHTKIVFGSIRKLVRHLVRPIEGRTASADLQLRIGALLEMMKVGGAYKQYIDQIDRTFSGSAVNSVKK